MAGVRTNDRSRQLASETRCQECKGRAEIYRGRTRINHRMDCSIRLRLLLTYPRFSRILEQYRSTPN